MSSIIAKVLIMRKLVIFFAVVWIALIVVLFSGCTHIMKERSTSKMANLNISVLQIKCLVVVCVTAIFLSTLS